MLRARVIVMLKAGVLDPQGRAVQGALHSMGYDEVRDVRVGKEILLTLGDVPEA
ncbi:MAG TPA: phosphoribosylformylglycinamidine synthase subunit PurS, partial [Verrucomicrobiae bacterium]|nr:phosphoribosylformylglycinamidine synthase subunit PurS [Verrucomicrobiae bacterium]